MSKDYYTYDELLQIVEKYIIGLNIRKICGEICKGKCCKGCNKCVDKDDKNLACSYFMCYSLRSKVFSMTVEQHHVFVETIKYIEYVIEHTIERYPYYRLFTKKQKDKMLFEKSKIKFLKLKPIDEETLLLWREVCYGFE